MEKFILNVLQLIIVVKVGYSLLRWMLFTRKSKKSIANKVLKLATNRIHYRLDNALKKQKKVLRTVKSKEVEYTSNVIPLRKTK